MPDSPHLRRAILAALSRLTREQLAAVPPLVQRISRSAARRIAAIKSGSGVPAASPVR
jgi:hypothetical protein